MEGRTRDRSWNLPPSGGGTRSRRFLRLPREEEDRLARTPSSEPARGTARALSTRRPAREDFRTPRERKRGPRRRRVRQLKSRSGTSRCTRSDPFHVVDSEENATRCPRPSNAQRCTGQASARGLPTPATGAEGALVTNEERHVTECKTNLDGRGRTTEDCELRSRTRRRIAWQTDSPSPELLRFRDPFPRPSTRSRHLCGWMDEHAKLHVQVGKGTRVHPVAGSARFGHATKACLCPIVCNLRFRPDFERSELGIRCTRIPNDPKTDRMGTPTDAVSWPPAFARHAFRILMKMGFGMDWKGPKHVAFVMDGNRRHADEKGFAREAGHAKGFQALLRALGWCFELGIRHVSAYAFSIENFRRERREVEALMDLAEAKLDTIADDPVLREHDVRVRVLGDLAQLPGGVQRAAKNAMKGTEGRKGAVLDIFLAYASRDEMAKAVDRLQEDVRQNRLQASYSDQEQLNARMMSHGSPPVELLLRTSGECRLSDFLLAQSSHAHLVFLDVLWPELGYWDLAGAILQHSTASAKRSLGEKNAFGLDPPIETVCRKASWSISKKLGA